MADDEALLTALTTEQFVLQSARGVISSEATGRATLYVGAVSSALVALGFTADLAGDGFAVFVASVLPALLVLGEFTFVRLLEISVEDLRYLSQIQRIRAYYATLHPEAPRFFPSGESAQGYAGLFRTMGLSERSRFQALFTAATAVAGINAIIAGAGIGLALRWFDASLAVAFSVGAAAAAVFVIAHIVIERRRYEINVDP